MSANIKTISPSDISGLKVWLDASSLTGLNDGDAVGSWRDMSGNSNHATQATTAQKPIYKTNQLNGKSTLLSAAGKVMKLGSGLSSLNNAPGAIVFCLAKKTSDNANGNHVIAIRDNSDSDAVGFSFLGCFAELGFYSRALIRQEIISLSQYLKYKWGF